GMDLLKSLNALPERANVALGVIDLGLSDDDRLAAGALCDRIEHLPGAGTNAGGGIPRAFLEARMAKHHLPDIFPEFGTLMWLDADIWVQSWSGISDCLSAAAEGALAIVPEEHPAYFNDIGSVAWRYNRFEALYGADTAKEMLARPHLNAGVFALARSAPHWRLWKQRFNDAVRHFAADSTLISDQIPLNHIIYGDGLPVALQPATSNWLCQLATPVWDDNQKVYCTPSPPHTVISTLHLAGRTKDAITWRVPALDGGQLFTSFRYGDPPHAGHPAPRTQD
ncbi:MAG: hypothetical protein ACR2PM_11715, partial [Hyphomicrobiales bacterium]